MPCRGRNLDNHCCWLNGKICPFLEENTEDDYRWSCGLRRELNSWDAVLDDSRYTEVLVPFWNDYEQRTGIRSNCKDWPGPGQKCGTCEAEG